MKMKMYRCKLNGKSEDKHASELWQCIQKGDQITDVLPLHCTIFSSSSPPSPSPSLSPLPLLPIPFSVTATDSAREMQFRQGRRTSTTFIRDNGSRHRRSSG